MNHKPSIHYDICGVPPCVEVHRHHPLWGYVCPLLLEEYDWFSIIKAESPFGALLNRYWPKCIDLFFGWLDNHPEYQDEDDLRVIHGVQSARRAFETFINPNSPSGQALRCTLEFWADNHRSEPLLIGEILVQDVSRDSG